MKEEQALTIEEEERRHFLQTAARLAGVLAALGITGETWSAIVNAGQFGVDAPRFNPKTVQASPKHQAIGVILLEAIRTEDLEAAILKFNKGGHLKDPEVNLLRRLTKEDLTRFAYVRDKLRPLVGDAFSFGFGGFGG